LLNSSGQRKERFTRRMAKDGARGGGKSGEIGRFEKRMAKGGHILAADAKG